MSDNKELLNEENYEKGKKKLTTIALTVVIIGILIGGSLIVLGLTRSSSSKTDSVKQQIEEEKNNLISIKSELESKIKPIQNEITSLKREKFTGFDDDYYSRQDRISELTKSIETDVKTIGTINDVIEDGSGTCNTFEMNYSYTSKYCSLVEKLSSISNKSYSIPFYMIGGFIIIASCMLAMPLFIITKNREILAFGTQQVMPVAQEGLEKMAPTVGKAGAEMAKQMTQTYGEIAKEISKGIKEGIKDEDNK